MNNEVKNRNVAPNSPSMVYGVMNFEEVTDFLEELNETDATQLGKIFANPSEYIVSLTAFPYDVGMLELLPESAGGLMPEGVPVHLGKFTFQRAKWRMIPYQYPIIHPDTPIIVNPEYRDDLGLARIMSGGSLYLPKKFGSYLDYAPYTKIQIYLPFVGFQTVDSADVVGYTVNVKYSIDYTTTNAVVTLERVTDPDRPDRTEVIYTFTGKVGVEMAIGNLNADQIAKNNLMTGIGVAGGLITSIASGKPAAAAAAIGGGIVGAINGNIQSITSRGTNGGGNGSMFLPLHAFYVCEYPKPVKTDGFAALIGRPLEEIGYLTDYHGFTSVSAIHLEGIDGATSEEVDEIERDLKNGVILP